ncbi:DUF1385 domain-containing protein [Adlercreutzia murintestinalis]|uniref:DUF1385 domain-containing protein n=1 Tax=Adlercreutzia murintestinalis TaxID=2941325 RepID=UPI00203A9BD7|nr:DUF1385 domain-containing protein [Adlercreutzia murintestinalis]
MAKESDLKRAFAEDGELKTHVGGQALLEGIMMRGKYNWAAAIRTPDGDIYVEEHDLASGKKGWLRWPLVRGCTALVESLALGFKALEIAAEHAFADDETEEERLDVQADALVDALESQFEPEQRAPEKAVLIEASGAPSSSVSVSASVPNTVSDPVPDAVSEPKQESADEGGLGKGAMTFSMIFGVVLGIVLFIVAPAALTNLIVGEYDSNMVLWNIVDGILRVAVFIFYIWLIGRMEDIRRMFMYHGAEHKTIHCFEHNLPLTPENARSFPRLHVRCGTAFLIMVLVIAIIVYTLVPVNALIAAWGVPDGLPKLALVIAVRLLFLPVIAGISYEITVKWAGSHPDNPLVKVILWPGMQMQYLTTNEPDDDQIECAIAAMQRVLEREEREATAVANT